ncbi:MAG: ISKra4 family transposase [Burkholderiaceae bacterium]
MQMIIEARLVGADEDAQGVVIPLGSIARQNDDIEQLGLSLAESKQLLAATQVALMKIQAASWIDHERVCRFCQVPLRRKDSRNIVMRTVFGKAQLNSPRFWACDCDQVGQWESRTVSPLSRALTKRVTPELAYLQTRWAAYLPYAASTALLRQVLPVDDCISASGSRNRIKSAGRQIEARIEQDIDRLSLVDDTHNPKESGRVSTISVDSVWVRHARPTPGYGRHVHITAGRATLNDGSNRVYAFVGRRIHSRADRLDQFLGRCGVRWDERVTVICDGANEFATAIRGSRLARGQVLDWFHLAMKFRAAEQSVVGSRQQEGPDWDSISAQITSAKWLVWHGKGRQAIKRLKTVLNELERWPGQEFSTLWWNVDKARSYVGGNGQYLANYSARHRRGLPISSAIAESAVNQVVSHRMAKKKQMRWSENGAHAMAQVRAAELNGELTPTTFGFPPHAYQFDEWKQAA